MKKRYFKLKSAEWIKENSYCDQLGDYWECEDDYVKWKNCDNHNVVKYLSTASVDNDIFIFPHLGESTRATVDIGWCVERELTKETTPEYWL